MSGCEQMLVPFGPKAVSCQRRVSSASFSLRESRARSSALCWASQASRIFGEVPLGQASAPWITGWMK
jgi:hypothetical protein